MSVLRECVLLLARSALAESIVKETPLRAMSRRFVPGESEDGLIAAVAEANATGLAATVNYLGEAEHDRESAAAAVETYLRVLERIGADGLRAGVSVKPSHLGEEIGQDLLLRNLERVLEGAERVDAFVRVDMESSDHTGTTLEVFEELWARGRRRIGVVLQSALRRTEGDVHRMNELGASVRLCKGAYAEPKEVAFQKRREVGESFIRSMKLLLAHGTDPAIATHDERMIQATMEFASRNGIDPVAFEFQMLHGVRRDLQRRLVSDGWRVRVYIPFGEAWYPYLMRRLAERPANLLFLAGTVIRESPMGFLWPGSNGSRR